MTQKLRHFSMIGLALITALALSLGAAVSPARAITFEGICVDAGGTWVDEGDPDTGLCFFPGEVTPGFCPGFEYYVAVVIGGSPVLAGCADGTDPDVFTGYFAEVGSIGFSCIEYGGIWQGTLDGWDGTCTFPDGSEVALDDCGSGYDSVYTLIGGEADGQECVDVVGGGGGGGGGSDAPRVPGFGQFGSTTNNNDSGGTLDMSGGKNGSVSYDPGTCSGKCTLGPNLPGGAHADLPDDAVDWLYFKSVDENGDPGTGTYTVCFNVGDLTSPVIYRYVSGAWVVVSSTVSGGQVCTSASGDGAFALGGS
ncbi:MAG: hypothetical protein EPO32_13210 [Anaerolineae bacterium]|nr:MAG: hypothetical protein EPO32_13210 [Anaerolineae bacterium]